LAVGNQNHIISDISPIKDDRGLSKNIFESSHKELKTVEKVNQHNGYRSSSVKIKNPNKKPDTM